MPVTEALAGHEVVRRNERATPETGPAEPEGEGFDLLIFCFRAAVRLAG